MRRVIGPCNLLLAFLVSINIAAGSVEGPLKYNIFPSRRQSCEVLSLIYALGKNKKIEPTTSKFPTACGHPQGEQTLPPPQVEVLEFPVPQMQCLAGGQHESTISLNLRNTGDEDIPVPYTVAVRNLEYLGASNPFNLALSSPDARNG